jgi:hypothetical protein
MVTRLWLKIFLAAACWPVGAHAQLDITLPQSNSSEIVVASAPTDALRSSVSGGSISPALTMAAISFTPDASIGPNLSTLVSPAAAAPTDAWNRVSGPSVARAEDSMSLFDAALMVLFGCFVLAYPLVRKHKALLNSSILMPSP